MHNLYLIIDMVVSIIISVVVVLVILYNLLVPKKDMDDYGENAFRHKIKKSWFFDLFTNKKDE